MYFQEEDNGYLIYDHDMGNESLPFDGWFHNCVFCHTICGSTIDFYHSIHNIKILCCKDCKSSSQVDNYEEDINSFIKKKLPNIRRKFFCNCN